MKKSRSAKTSNPAEFGGVADVTTVSKSGTNEFHGGLFENVQNTDFNAADTFANTVTEDKMNNFGIYLGGPVILPKLYNGRNKTFFFGSFEVLRLPKNPRLSSTAFPLRPCATGDLSAYLNPNLGGDGVVLTGYQQSDSQEPVESLHAETAEFALSAAEFRPAGSHMRTTISASMLLPSTAPRATCAWIRALAPST